jgi:hypothetical protein
MSAPTPASTPKLQPEGSPRFLVNEQLEAAGALFRAYLLKCLPLAMVSVLASSAADLYLRLSGQAPIAVVSNAAKLTLPHDPVYWVLYLAGTLLSVLLTCTVVLRLQALRAGRQPAVADNLRAALRRWLPAVIATLLAMVTIALGLVMLLVPGIYFAVCALVLLPVVLFEPLEPAAALLRSFQLVRPVWVKVFACALISILIGVICLLALTGILGLLFGAVLENHVAEAVLQALILTGLAAFYVFFAALSLTIHTALSTYTAASSSA